MKFHDPRAIGCRDMTAEKFDGFKRQVRDAKNQKRPKKPKKKEIQNSEKNSYAKCH